MSATERFQALSQDIPRGNPTSEVMAIALGNVKKKRQDALIAQCEQLVEKGLELQATIKKARNELSSKEKGWEKELNKIVGRIEAYNRGQEPPQEQEQGQQQEN